MTILIDHYSKPIVLDEACAGVERVRGYLAVGKAPCHLELGARTRARCASTSRALILIKQFG